MARKKTAEKATDEKTEQVFDLKRPVLDMDGNPEPGPQDFKVAGFDKPVEVSYSVRDDSGKTVLKTDKFQAGIFEFKKLTFRTLFMRSLRSVKDEEKNVPDIDRRTELMFKIIADSCVLDVEEQGDIIKCVRAQKDPFHLMRVKEFFKQS